MTDAQAHITAFWSEVAPDYEAHAGNVAAYGTDAYQQWVDALGLVLPPPPAEVLDLAAGTGYVSVAAAGLGLQVTAIDLSSAMLEELATNAHSRGVPVKTCLGDAVAPDLPPASFDAVISRHFLWTLREPAVALANWLTLLRPGGRLVAVDGFWFTDGDAGPPLFAQHYSAATQSQLPFMHLDRPEPILAEMSRAGFVEESAEFRPDLGLADAVPYLFTARRP